ncbi:hypothetical protein Thi970DRAFT_01246 [Thiorhodovibrio frisius]|uniref:Uncharacterized protein n=1 Tax=Thiorhodovibrio frisius TaxID=631362 RepID=H8YYP8_9GAMM|nr:hypothetical protein Thi970DRAFT_01246 [Thiorhodovibrio frisius]WPL23339.1 hypothetical protein Thiofri_03524 [Thiorhodovibrio frisius]
MAMLRRSASQATAGCVSRLIAFVGMSRLGVNLKEGVTFMASLPGVGGIRRVGAASSIRSIVWTTINQYAISALALGPIERGIGALE